jgi:hypothetical protein
MTAVATLLRYFTAQRQALESTMVSTCSGRRDALICLCTSIPSRDLSAHPAHLQVAAEKHEEGDALARTGDDSCRSAYLHESHNALMPDVSSSATILGQQTVSEWSAEKNSVED